MNASAYTEREISTYLGVINGRCCWTLRLRVRDEHVLEYLVFGLKDFII